MTLDKHFTYKPSLSSTVKWQNWPIVNNLERSFLAYNTMSLKIATRNLHVSLCLLLLTFKRASPCFHNIPDAKRSMTNKQLSNSYLPFKPEESFPNAMGKPKRMGKVSLKSPFLGLSKHPSYLWSCNQRSIFFSIWFYLPWHGTDFLSHSFPF